MASNFIVNCLMAKVKSGLLNKEHVQDIVDTLKDLNPTEALDRSRALVKQYDLALTQSVKQSFNHLENLVRYENIIKDPRNVGNFKLLRQRLIYEFSEKVEDSQWANVAL